MQKFRDNKKKPICLLLLLSTGMVLTLSGCRLPLFKEKGLPSLTFTATPSPTAAPVITEIPVATPTLSPRPTITPAPRQIGSKKGSAGFIHITNQTGQRIREITIRAAEIGEWSRNLIPAESSIRGGEGFRLFYPSVEGVSGSNGINYDLQLKTYDGSLYCIFGVPVYDMSSADLRRDSDGALYLSYMSLSEQTEKNTRNTSWTEYSGYEDWDYVYDDYGDEDWEDSGSTSGSSGNNSSNNSGNNTSDSSDSEKNNGDSIENELDYDDSSEEEWDYILEEDY